MLTVLLLLVLTGLVESSSHVTPTRVTRQARGRSITDLPGLIKNLYSTNQEDRRLTKLQILTIAKQSEENRAKISHELTALLRQRQTPSATWSDVADILGELRATEAIGELVRQLNHSGDNGIGLSLAHWPAVRALINIGDASVPELARALNEGTESIRGFAAQTLGQIQGAEAKQALERALATERDESIREAIRRSLASAR